MNLSDQRIRPLFADQCAVSPWAFVLRLVFNRHTSSLCENKTLPITGIFHIFAGSLERCVKTGMVEWTGAERSYWRVLRVRPASGRERGQWCCTATLCHQHLSPAQWSSFLLLFFVCDCHGRDGKLPGMHSNRFRFPTHPPLLLFPQFADCFCLCSDHTFLRNWD